MTTNKIIVFWLFISLFFFEWQTVTITAIVVTIARRVINWAVKDIDDTWIN